MYIGFDIGGTNVKYGVLNDLGEIIEKDSIPTNLNLENLLNDLSKITEDYKKKYTIQGIGVSAPGIVKRDGFMLTGGAIRELYGVNLKEKIEKITGLHTKIENDANSAAIAERWIGAAIDIENYLCVVLGTGVGGGVIINGQVYRGAHGMAGEFGYMMTQDINLSRNIDESSMNLNSSVINGLCLPYNEELLKKDPEAEKVMDATKIIARANDGDLTASKVLKQFYQNIGVGILNLVSCFDPEVILIGGGISASEEFISTLITTIDDLKERHRIFNYLRNKIVTTVKPAKLKNDAGIIGAVYQVKQDLLKNKMIK